MKLRLALILLIGCRGSESARPDAATSNVDAPNPMVDAPSQMADAMVDAPPVVTPATTRIWARGDIMTDNQDVAVAFGHPTTGFPFGPSNAPALSIANVRSLDVRGDKIAYVTAASSTAAHSLFVAGADNSNPVKVHETAAGVEITAITLSPDTTKIAFTMDSAAINGGYDLYFAPTTANATPVKISPDRPGTVVTPADLDVFSVFTWSADSKFVAESGDLTENAFDQAYTADTTATSPAAVELLGRADIATQASGAQGVRGGLHFDSANNIYFRARVDMNSTQFKLFTATPTGTRTEFALPARGDASAADASGFAISPDGTKIVFSADAPTVGQFELYINALPVAAAPTKLTTLTAVGEPQFTAPIVFSPDATKVAVIADWLGGDGNYEPFVVHLDGTTQTPRRLIDLPSNCTSCDAEAMIWNKEGTAIYTLGDYVMNNDSRLFLVDPSMTDQTPTLAVTTPTSGDIFQIFADPL